MSAIDMSWNLQTLKVNGHSAHHKTIFHNLLFHNSILKSTATPVLKLYEFNTFEIRGTVSPTQKNH